jgi:hypothetical protein
MALIAAATHAGPIPQRGWKKEITLEPTAYGEPMDAKGIALIGVKNDVEYFGLRVFCTEPDGTRMTVYAEDSSGASFMVGSMDMFLGSASIYMESARYPSDVFPVVELRRIWVECGGESMLVGSF